VVTGEVIQTHLRETTGFSFAEIAKWVMMTARREPKRGWERENMTEPKQIQAGTYENLDALKVLWELNAFRENTTAKLLFGALMLNWNELKITIIKYHKYSDNSGTYEAKIEHPEFPEGFEMHIEQSGDMCNFEIKEWAYGGG
jgi:hypothetical protein